MKKKIQKIIKTLYTLYEPKCALNHKNPFQLLVATILSAQCTDIRVNIVTDSLFKKYKTIKSFAQADYNEFCKDIKSTGFYKNKAKFIIETAKIIVTQYNSKIPKKIEELIKLPGVGRKTANVVLGNAFNIISGIVVDTHVKRLSNRLGLVNTQNPEQIEKELMKIINKKDWINFSHLLILHGRAICKARKPDCPNCKLNKECPFFNKEK